MGLLRPACLVPVLMIVENDLMHRNPILPSSSHSPLSSLPYVAVLTLLLHLASVTKLLNLLRFGWGSKSVCT